MKKLVWLFALALFVGGLVRITPPAAAQHGGGSDSSMKIRLFGAAIAGIRPEGSAEFRARGARLKFEIEAKKVNLLDATVLSANVNGVSVGSLTLTVGRGKLELESPRSTVPTIHKGDVVTVMNATGDTILSGTF